MLLIQHKNAVASRNSYHIKETIYMTHEVEAAVYILHTLEEIEKTGDVYAETNNLIRKNPVRRAKTMRSFKKSKSSKKNASTRRSRRP